MSNLVINVVEERLAVAREAASWVDTVTPYMHGQSVKGIGVDCARFLIAVYANVGLIEPFEPEYYSPEWFLHEQRERLVEVVSRYCDPVGRASVGDVVLFRFGRRIAHGAICLGGKLIVHADRQTKRVGFETFDAGDFLGGRFAGAWTLKRWVAA